MQLTEIQRDALAELINIGFGRTAASLSQLTGHRVMLDVPEVSIRAIDELDTLLAGRPHTEFATVHQIFSGAVAGDALLLLDYEGAVNLVGLLTDSRLPTGHLDASDQEVLMEVGNILLNACLGTFGNLLQVHLSFTVPRLHFESLNIFLESLTIGHEELRYALVVSTNFYLRDSAVEGYLVIILGISSLDRLLDAVEHWEQSQV